MHVHTRLRDSIILGDVVPGEPLREGDLAERYGTSRTPVREALSQLLVQGFVEHVPGRGYSVARSSVNDVKDTFEIRLLIEGEAAARAALSAGAEAKAQMRALARCDIRVGDSASYAVAIERNDRFHAAVAEASNNALMVELVKSCLSQMTRFASLGGFMTDESMHSDAEHLAIVDAIETGDAELARMVMRRHLANRYDNLLSAAMGPARIT